VLGGVNGNTVTVGGDDLPVKVDNVKRAAGPMAVGVVLLGLAGSLAFGWVDWAAHARWASERLPVLVSLLGGVVLAAVGVVRFVRPRAGRRAPLSWWVIAAGIALVVIVSWGATAWLLAEASKSKDPSAARVDAVKTGLGIGAGTGGVLALLLAVRRQWHQETTAAEVNHDATERRVTELYTKAVEQLGSDKAPVRLGGLYALERLAQDNPTQRQTIANVLCAYLRMPYTLPGDPPDPDTSTDADTRKELLTEHRDRTQEREVRLTAQRILTTHTRPGPNSNNPLDTFWVDLDLDFTGATLIDFDLNHCVIHTARFTSVSFTGSANFGGATFTGSTSFDRANFAEGATFFRVTFADWASFGGVTFADWAIFDGATFADWASFGGVTFTHLANFDRATFTGSASFGGATFTRSATFGGATFIGSAHFNGATFTEMTSFHVASFTDMAVFYSTTFAGVTSFGGVTFAGEALFDGATFADKEGVPAELASHLSAEKAPNRAGLIRRASEPAARDFTVQEDPPGPPVR
jgi:uncharacterized protein YjbI with pentapeptide repeats